MSDPTVLIEWGDNTSNTYTLTRGVPFTVPTYTYASNATFLPKVTVLNGTASALTVDATGANSVKLGGVNLSQATGIEEVVLKGADLSNVTMGAAVQAGIQALTIQESSAALKVDSATAGKADLSSLPASAAFTLTGNSALTELVTPTGGFASAEVSQNALTASNVAAIVEAGANSPAAPALVSVHSQVPLAAVKASQKGLQTLVVGSTDVRADISVFTADVTPSALNFGYSLITSQSGAAGSVVLQPDVGSAASNVTIGTNQTTTISYATFGAKKASLVQKYNGSNAVTAVSYTAGPSSAPVSAVDAGGSAQLGVLSLTNAPSLTSLNLAKATNAAGAVTTDPLSQSGLTSATVTGAAITALDASYLGNLTTLAATGNSSLANVTVVSANSLGTLQLGGNNLSKAAMESVLSELDTNGFSGPTKVLSMLGQGTGAVVDNTNANLITLVQSAVPCASVPCLTGFSATVNIINAASAVDIQFQFSALSGYDISVTWETAGIPEVIATTGIGQTVTHNYTTTGTKNITVTGIQGLTALTLLSGTGVGTGTLNKWTSVTLNDCLFLSLLNATGQALTTLSVNNCYALITATLPGNTLNVASVNALFTNLDNFNFPVIGITPSVNITGSATPTGEGLTAKNALIVKGWSITP